MRNGPTVTTTAGPIQTGTKPIFVDTIDAICSTFWTRPGYAVCLSSPIDQRFSLARNQLRLASAV